MSSFDVLDWGRVIWTGLLAGLTINLIDVPNSIFLTGAALRRYLSEKQAKPHPLMPPYFLTVHFVLGISITLVYGLLVQAGPGSLALALVAVLVPVVINRLFGFGFVLLDVFPGRVFIALSASLVLGGLGGGLLGGGLYRNW